MAKTELATDKLADDLLAGKVHPDQYMDKHRAITKGAPSLNGLIKKINAEHQLVLSSGQSTIAHAVRAGELLIEAKKKCKHGQWLPLVEAECEFPERTARKYMQAAKCAEKQIGLKRPFSELLPDLSRIIGGKPAKPCGDMTLEMKWARAGERVRKLARDDLLVALRTVELWYKELKRDYGTHRAKNGNHKGSS